MKPGVIIKEYIPEQWPSYKYTCTYMYISEPIANVSGQYDAFKQLHVENMLWNLMDTYCMILWALGFHALVFLHTSTSPHYLQLDHLTSSGLSMLAPAFRMMPTSWILEAYTALRRGVHPSCCSKKKGREKRRKKILPVKNTDYR